DVFRLLVRRGPAGLPAGTIAERLSIPSATLSFHLKELARAGLIVDRRNGRSIIYSLNVEGMRSLLGFLLKDCCGGRTELGDLTIDRPNSEEPCCPTRRRPRPRTRQFESKKSARRDFD